MNLLAIAWGLVEATVFFIVPDVLLTYLALKDPRRATKACIWTLVGALVGGIVMFCWGHYDPKSAAGFLTQIPAIDEIQYIPPSTDLRFLSNKLLLNFSFSFSSHGIRVL